MHPTDGAPGKEVHHTGRHLRFCTIGHWEYIERTRAESAVVVAALTPEREVVLVEQHRPPLQGQVIELPAGLVGDDGAEEALEAARRELLEETGFEAANWQFVTTGPISPGLSTETIHLLVATGLTRRNGGGGVHGESIRVHLVSIAQAHPWLEARRSEGKLVDPKVYAGLFFLMTQDRNAAGPPGRA